MALVVTDDKHYKAIADKMRQLYNTEDKFFPKDMAQNVEALYNEAYMFGTEEGEETGYDKGYSDGERDGFEDGFGEGAESEYSAFWDVYQKNGDRKTYTGAFYGNGWNAESFKPKYDMNIASGLNMFREFGKAETEPIDLVSLLENCGVAMDFSTAYSLEYTFYNSNISRIGTVIVKAGTPMTSAFALSKLVTIEKLVLAEGQNYGNALNSCTELKNLIIDGVITQDGFNVSWSTLLTHDSLMSIINALKNYNGSGTTRTVTLGATNLAKLTDAEKAIATQKGWSLA